MLEYILRFRRELGEDSNTRLIEALRGKIRGVGRSDDRGRGGGDGTGGPSRRRHSCRSYLLCRIYSKVPGQTRILTTPSGTHSERFSRMDGSPDRAPLRSTVTGLNGAVKRMSIEAALPKVGGVAVHLA